MTNAVACTSVSSRHPGRSRIYRELAFALFLAIVSGAAARALARAPNIPDPVAVKAKIEKMGEGQHVMVKLVTGRTLRGHIASIGDTSFTLKADRTGTELSIPYEHVRHVKENPGPVFWMAVGAIIVIVIIVVT